jgi:hypothetical protein
VIGECHGRHRHQEWRKFLRRLDAEFPPELKLHPVEDIIKKIDRARVKMEQIKPGSTQPRGKKKPIDM